MKPARLLVFALVLGTITAACKSQTSTPPSLVSKTPTAAKNAEATGKGLTPTPTPAMKTTPTPATIKEIPMPPDKTPQPATSAAATSPRSNPVVVIKTNLGSIEVELDPANAPITTRNFLSYVAKRHYDGTIFHRVIADFMIQGGGFTRDFTEKSTGPGIKNESGNGLSNARGTISMARTTQPDSATAQFFINVKDNPGLDNRPGRPGYAVFGKVIAGMDVVDKIRVVLTHSITAPDGQPYKAVPVQTVLIESITVKQ